MFPFKVWHSLVAVTVQEGISMVAFWTETCMWSKQNTDINSGLDGSLRYLGFLVALPEMLKTY